MEEWNDGMPRNHEITKVHKKKDYRLKTRDRRLFRLWSYVFGLWSAVIILVEFGTLVFLWRFGFLGI